MEKWSASAVDEWYDAYWEKHPSERPRGQELERDITKYMCELYLERYEQHEREIEIPAHMIGAGKFRGYIDGRIDPHTLVEDKFKSQWTATDIEALKMDDQVIGYVAMYSRMSGIKPEDIVLKYRPTRKPALRQRKEESSIDFLIRIKQDVMGRLDWYFNEEDVVVTQDQVDAWWVSTRGTATLMEVSRDRDIWPRNTGSCKQFGRLCDMWSICSASDTPELSAALDGFTIKESTR